MRIDDRSHLSYCTNVHPAQTADEVLRVVQHDVPAVRRALGDRAPAGSFGVGLRISDEASRPLATPGGLEALQQRLDEHDLYVFTVNGFPYGRFHGEAVKDAVHRPDWTEPERLDYLVRLAGLLARLRLPDNEGSISTSPLAYRGHHPDAAAARQVSARALAELCGALRDLEERTGQWIHVDLEPEPDGILEQLHEARRFFVDELFLHGRDHLAEQAHIARGEAEAWLRRYLGVCLDVCHAAVVFESVDDGIAGLAGEGIAIGKIQLSSALEARFDDAESASAVARALTPFDEPVYLHQVAIRDERTGRIDRHPDLGPALDTLATSPVGLSTLRTHFHVPLFLEDYGPLTSTQAAVRRVLARNDRGALCRHLEVETYTWGVLPEGIRTELHASIARELAWVLDRPDLEQP